MGDDNAVVTHLAEAHQVATGQPLGPVAITGFCDLHQHGLNRATPGCLFGPGGGGGAHSVDEFFDLNDLAPVTKTAIAFVLDWCGWEAA
jgi:acetylornithine deacetylase/succinyl-diaminopimelate desuccinylase-like protein